MIPTAKQLDTIGWNEYFSNKVQQVKEDLLWQAKRGKRSDCFTINPIYTKQMKKILNEAGYQITIYKDIDGEDYFQINW